MTMNLVYPKFKNDFRECERKHATAQNFMWPHEILYSHVTSVLFLYLFPNILEYDK